MSFPRYPEYKDSGVEWLGAVPKHWEVVPLKHVIRKIESGTSVNSTDVPAGAGELGVLKTSCVYSGTFEAGENKAVVPEEYDRVACPVTAGTLVVSRMNTPDLVGAAGLVQKSNDALFLPDRLWQVAFTDAEPAYVHYWTLTRGYRAQVQMACAGTSSSMQNLAQDQFRSFVFPKPTSDEQSVIAAYLDHETAKLDNLMAEQEKLIELLKEKRQSVIAHAVTKGLDPTVPMKHSGVEWLGNVPAHWNVASLKRYWSVTDCKHITAEFVDDGVPLASIREVQSRFVELQNAKQTTDAFYEQLIESGRQPLPGDLIFSRNATVGEVAQVAKWHPPFAMGQDVCLLRKKAEDLSSDYFQALLLSPVVVEQLANLMVGSTFKRVNVEEIRNLIVPMPPGDDQAAIAEFIEREADAFDALLHASQHVIDLLKERRTALIAAAVTGQIDVRGLIKDEQEQAA